MCPYDITNFSCLELLYLPYYKCICIVFYAFENGCGPIPLGKLLFPFCFCFCFQFVIVIDYTFSSNCNCN